MKIIKIILGIVVFSVAIYAQDMRFLSMVNEIGEKHVATYGDAVQLFTIEMKANTFGFTANCKALEKTGILKGFNYDEQYPLRKGLLAKMIVRYLKLNDSMLFGITKMERYAFQACTAAAIMDDSGSEWDVISGDELLEIMALVSEKKGD